MTKVKEVIGKTGKPALRVTTTFDLPPAIYVAIDVAKYYCKAMIFDLKKNVLEKPFDFNITRGGLEILSGKIEYVIQKFKAGNIIVGLEPTAHYHEPLVEHLRQKGYQVQLINPYATFKARALNADYIKTDSLDVKAIAEAILLNKGRQVKDQPEIYGQLRRLTRFRRSKNRARVILKVQMLRDLDRLWPHLVKYSKDSQGLFANLWESKVARILFKLNLLPQNVANLTAQELVKLSKTSGFSGLGPRWAKKIIAHAAQTLICRGEIAGIHQQVFQTNLSLLEDLNVLIEKLDCQIAILLHDTPAIHLLSIQGISSVTAAEFIAEIGNPAKYSSPGEWVRLAGLNASAYQSGLVNRKTNPMTKVGNKYLRCTLFTIARNISRWEPLFISRRDRLLAKGKPIGVAYGAVANKFLRIAFKMLLEKADFDPNHEKTVYKKEGRDLTQNY
ncbi:MAG: IS110 family transposase [Candidatus Margulisiibacteriota bacterium]